MPLSASQHTSSCEERKRQRDHWNHTVEAWDGRHDVRARDGVSAYELHGRREDSGIEDADGVGRIRVLIGRGESRTAVGPGVVDVERHDDLVPPIVADK